MHLEFPSPDTSPQWQLHTFSPGLKSDQWEDIKLLQRDDDALTGSTTSNTNTMPGDASLSARAERTNGILALNASKDPSIANIEKSLLASAILHNAPASERTPSSVSSHRATSLSSQSIPAILLKTCKQITADRATSFLIVIYVLALSAPYIFWSENSTSGPSLALALNASLTKPASSYPKPITVPATVDFPKLMQMQIDTVARVYDSLTTSAGVTHQVSSSAAAVRDLSIVVEYSDLVHRAPLTERLDKAADLADAVVLSYQRFTVKLNSAVDSTVREQESSYHAILRAMEACTSTTTFNTVVTYLTFQRPSCTIDSTIVAAFIEAMSDLSVEVGELIVEVKTLIGQLVELEEGFRSIHKLIFKENKLQDAEYDKILSNLWTVLGGNQDKVKRSKNNLELLRFLEIFRKNVVADVRNAFHVLQDLVLRMEDLRKQMSIPELVGDRVPLSVQLEGIEKGLSGMKSVMESAKIREREAYHRGLPPAWEHRAEVFAMADDRN